MSERKAFIAKAIQPGANVSQLCQAYGISRKTAYKWLRRYREGGVVGLEDRSRRPQHSPHQTSSEAEALVLTARERFPAWGGRKLKAYLQHQGHRSVPSASTITTILQRHGYLDEAQSAKHRAFQRFEKDEPNALWQMDFKGDFHCGDGRRCYPLSVLDDHSRYLIGLFACSNQQRETVQGHLTTVFRQVGLPDCILADNGSPWGDTHNTPDGRRVYTRLSVWLLRLGVRVIHGRPYHPQTQGKVERFHRTLQTELVNRSTLAHLTDCQIQFDDWRTTYNTLRPHDALDLQPPDVRYQFSPRPLPDTLPEIVYPDAFFIRKVNINGQIHFQGKRHRVGRAFAGYPVGLLADPLQDGVYAVYFCHTHIHTLDLRVA